MLAILYSVLSCFDNETGVYPCETLLGLSFVLSINTRMHILSVAMSVIGQCQTSAILLNNQNAKFNNGSIIDMLFNNGLT